jgi:hypothetical protein
LAILQVQAGRARRITERAAGEALGGPVRLPRLRLLRVLWPYPRVPRRLEVVRHLSYGPDPAHLADRYRRRRSRRPNPRAGRHGTGPTRW